MTEQASAIAPEKPFVGVMVRVEVLPVGAPPVTEMAGPLIVKPGPAVTVSMKLVLATSAPEVPLIVMGTALARAALLLAVSVNTWVPALPAAKLAVTPAGKPVAPRVTTPLKPPMLPIEIVTLLEAPCCKDTAL